MEVGYDDDVSVCRKGSDTSFFWSEKDFDIVPCAPETFEGAEQTDTGSGTVRNRGNC
jgi:hypothetical protein